MGVCVEGVVSVCVEGVCEWSVWVCVGEGVVSGVGDLLWPVSSPLCVPH